jgi:ABC-2 type transport system ATP-binding protein
LQAPVIELERLVKRFGEHRALAELSVAIPPGTVGLLGPNGAGKTTLIKVLLGLLSIDGGRARIRGLDPSRRKERMQLRRAVGYMPEGDCLLPRMTAVELVSTLGRITGLSPEDAMTRAHEALDYVGLEEQRYRDLEEYSTGMKQRLKLAQALAHDPPILLLDEPTNGLDPKGRRHMLELIRDLGHQRGKQILLCSHLLPDVERTCDHVVVIDHGRVVLDGAIGELTGAQSQSVRVRVDDPAGAFAAALAAAGRRFEREGDGALRVLCENGQERDADQLFAMAHAAGTPLSAVETVRSTLDQVFMQVLSRSAT